MFGIIVILLYHSLLILTNKGIDPNGYLKNGVNIFFWFVAVITLHSGIILGCSSQGDNGRTRFDPNKTMAWGSVQKISVFADDSVWKYAETPLRSSLERFYYTTENETYFDVERVGFNKIEQFYKFNNLIFFCNISS